jgi:subtilase family serine protease
MFLQRKTMKPKATVVKMRKASLTLAVVAALGCALTLDAGAAITDANVPATVGHGTVLGGGDSVVGTLPMTHPIHVEVALKLRDREGLDAFIENNAKVQAKGMAAHLMTPAQFLANHAPTPVQAQTVANYLTNMGFRNVVIAPNRLLVSADGTAATARNAFLTTFAQIRKPDGRIAFANTTEVRIPQALAGTVLAVLGLQTVHQAHTFAKRLAPSSGLHTLAITGHFPTEFPSIYGVGSAPVASDIGVGIITEGDLTATLSDLNTFTTNHGLPAVTTEVVDTNGTSTDASGTGEWDLDSQDIVGMAGGQVRKIVFYNIPSLNNSDLVADFNTVVTTNDQKIINVSLGECETGAQGDGSAAAADVIFAQGVAQGQTFSISTGDSGANECGHGKGTTPSWPANSQYVIAAAGTTLNASTTTWASETEWASSGGSESTYEPKPTWQTLWSGTHRGVADIAFDADPNSGSKIIVNGALAQYGGTSLSAPLFAGVWARVLQANGKYFGFAGPVIYALPAADFHDITTGDNGGGNIGVGYDLESGRGSMIISSVLADITANGLGNHPPVATFSYVADGLSVNFNDTSTDVDNNIASHFWTFGDGTTSTAANPTHAYTAVGTYVVKDKVTDSLGAFSSKSKNVTVTPYQLIANPGFEAGVPGHWSMNGGALQNNASLAHAGSWYASMGGAVLHSEHVNQIVTIPAGLSSATLSFYLNTFTAETGASANDNLNVQVYVGGVLDSTLATYSNLDATSGYVVHNLDMSAYIGQTVTLKFLGSNNATLPTTWYLDDVTLMAQ